MKPPAKIAISATRRIRSRRPSVSPPSRMPGIIRAAAAWRRSRSRSGAAAPPRRRSAAATSSNSPTAVGPEPVTSERAGADLVERRERLGDLGAQRDRGPLEVVDEQLGVGERRGAGGGGLAQAGAELVELVGRAPELERVGLARRPPRCRGRARRGSSRGRDRPGPEAARPPRRRPRRARTAARSCDGTSAPSAAAISGRSSSSPAREPQHRGGVGAAPAEPGGDRDPLLDLDPHRRAAPAPRPHRLERHRRPGSAPRPPRRRPRPRRRRRPRSRSGPRARAGRTASAARAGRPRDGRPGRGRG